MARYEVIKDVCDSLAHVVALEAQRQKLQVEALVAPPDKAFFAGTSPAVAVYPYRFHVDRQLNQLTVEREREEVREDEQGQYVVQFPPPLAFNVHLAVAGRGKSAADEQLMLGLALKAFYEFPVLRNELKQGKSLQEGDIHVEFDDAFSFEQQTQLLASLGVSHHALLGYRLTLELEPERELGRTRRVERRVMELIDRHNPPPGKGEQRAAPTSAQRLKR